MQKTTKKLLSILLTLVMLLSLCAPVFHVSATEELTKVEAWNLSLGDEIAANFYVSVSNAVSDDAVMVVTDGYGTHQYPISDAEQDKSGNYIFTARMAAAQLTDFMTLQLQDGENEGVIHTYSAVDYANSVLGGNYGESTKALVKAMLHYGAAAQTYFAYNTENLANAGIGAADAVEIPAVDTSNMVSGKVSGISFYGASLVFQSKVAVRFYFKVTGNIADYTFSTGTPMEKDGLYYIEVADINPQDYANTITLTVNDTLTVNYSPLTYISRKANGTNEALSNLVKAMYAYHLAAVNYAPDEEGSIDLVTVTFSDVQLVTEHRGATTNGPKSLKDHLNYAKSTDADVLFMPGDIVNNADQSYYDRFWSIFKSVYGTDESLWPELIWTMGNHEWYDLSEKNASNAISMFKANAKIESPNLVKMSQVASESNPGETVANYYKVVDGVPFVVISGDSSSMRVSDAQKAEIITWLDEINELPSVKAGTPIYVAYHGPIADVTFFGQGTADESKVVDEILKNYPNTIVFTGHTHYASINERTINQVDYTAINLGSSSYSRIASRGAASQAGEKYYNAGGSDKDIVNGDVAFGYEYVQNLMVLTNNADGSVQMNRYVTDTNVSDARKVGITWNFPAGLSKDKFIYTNDRFQNQEWANTLYGKNGLTFPENAGISFSVEGTEMMVYFDDVTDHNYAEHYKITVTADGANSKVYDVVGNYYKFYEEAQTYHFLLEDIPAGTNYSVEVKAYDFFDNESLNSLMATTESATSLFADVVDSAFVSTYTDISTRVNYEVTAGSASSVEAYYRGDYLYTYGATLGTVLDKEDISLAEEYTVTNWSHSILSVKVKNVGDDAVNVGLSVVLDDNGDNKWLTDFGGAYRQVVEANGQWTELTWDLKELFGIYDLESISFIRLKASSTAPSEDGYAMHLYLDDIDFLQGEDVIEPGEVVRGDSFAAGQGITKQVEDGNYATVSFEYKLTGEGKISVFLRGADAWLNSYGNLDFDSNGAIKEYAGVTTEKLSDGYIRVTMNVAELTEIYNNKPNGLCALEIFGSWSTAGGYIDNVQFSTESIEPEEPTEPEDIHEFTAGKGITLMYDNAAYTTVSFDYKLTSEGTMTLILRDAENWTTRIYGDYTFNATGLVYSYGNYQSGVTCEVLENGYVRVTMDLAALQRTNLSDNRNGAPTNIGVFDIYSWTSANGSVANVKFSMGDEEPEEPTEPEIPDEPVIRGEFFTAEDGITIELGSSRALTQLSFEYKLTTGDNMAVTLRNNDWSSNYYGVFEFSPSGAASTYAGVTTEKLSDGYIRVTFDMAALTKMSGTPGEIITRFCVYAGWTNTDGYIDNIQKVYVPLDRGEELSAGKDWTATADAAAYEEIFFDYRLTNDGKIAVVLLDDNGTDYYGKFYFNASGAVENYAGVTTSVRADGFIKASFSVAELAKHSGTAPDKIAAIKILGSESTATGYADSATFKTQSQPKGVRVGIISDSHIKYASYSDTREYDRLINALTMYKNKGVDAIIVAGDLQYFDLPIDDDTVNEPKAAMESFAQAWFSVFPDNMNLLTGEKVEPIFIYGNHDAYLVAEKYWPTSLGEYADAYIKEVNGYYFIAAHYGMETRAVDLLSYVKEDSNGYPFFYVQHDTLSNTVYGIEGNYTNVTKPMADALSDSYNAVTFSGHYHLTSTDERSIWQPSNESDHQFTSISVPSIYYATSEDLPGLQYGQNSNVVQGMYMVVDGTDVTITRMDFTNGGAQVGEDWSFDAADPTDKPYGYETRAENVEVSFASDAKLEVSMSGDTITATFPAASVTVPAGFSDQIYAYFVDVVDVATGNVVKTEGILTDYMVNDKPENFVGPYTVTVSGLDPNGNYEVRVYAKDFLQVSSDPLVAEVNAAQARGDAFEAGTGIVKYTEDGQYETVSFEYMLVGEGKISVFLRGADAWLNSYGNFDFNADGAAKTYAGVTTEKLSDDYIRVTMNVAELDEIFNNEPNGLSALEIFGSWSTASGYIDNVQFTAESSEPEEPTEPEVTEPEEIYEFTAGVGKNILVENAAYTTVSFDYKLTTEGTMTLILRDADNWTTKVYGDYTFHATGLAYNYGSYQSGITCEALDNGYVRVTMVLSELQRTVLADNRNGAPEKIGVFDIYSWSSANGYVTNVKFSMGETEEPETPTEPENPDEPVIRGDVYNAGEKTNYMIPEGDYATISFEYKLTTDGYIRVMLRSPADSECYGSFYFTAEGEREDYSGVVCEKLSDGYIRVTVTTKEVTITGNSDGREKVPATVNKVCVYRDSTASGYIDNIQVTEKDPTEEEYRGMYFVGGATSNVTLDNTVFEEITFEYKLVTSGEIAVALRSPSDVPYYGLYYFNANGLTTGNNSGIYTEKLSDGYIRVKMVLEELNRTNNNDDRENVPETVSKLVFYKFGTANGYVDNVELKLPPPERGDALTAGQDWSYTIDAAAYETVMVDYRLTNDGQVAFALTDAAKTNYFGYFYFDQNGEVEDYAGVSTMVRSDEYIKITFDIAELAINNGVAPSSIACICIEGDESTATGFVDYVQFKKLAEPTGVRFGVLSDVHVGVFEDDQYTVRLIHALTAFKERGVDAVLISGDLQNHTTDLELSKKWIEIFAETWFSVFPNNTNDLTGEHVEPVFICGNHDQQLVAEQYWPESLGAYSDAFIKEVNGYYFVGANFWRESAASDYILRAKEDSNGYPFFYTQHCTLYNTVYGITDSGHGTAETNLDELWDAYNAITFTGHTHIPATDERSIWQSLDDKYADFTAIQVPSLNYGRLSDLGLTAPGNYDLCEQGMYVEVVGSDVTITRLDLADHDNVMGEQMGEKWSFDASDPTDRPYDYTVRAEQAHQPEFADDAEISVDFLSKTQITITVPAATVTAPEGFSDAIQLYYVELVKVATGEIVQTDLIETDYLYDLKPERFVGPFRTTFFGLEDNTEYQLRVYAREFYQVQSEPLIYNFNTANAPADVIRGQQFTAATNTYIEFAADDYKAISFDYRVTGVGDMVIVLRSPEWIPYYGTFTFDANGETVDYEGIDCQRLDDNFIRVTMYLSELNVTNSNNDRLNAPSQVDTIDIYDWTTVNGYFDNLQLYKQGDEIPEEPEITEPEVTEPEVTVRGERFEAGVTLTKYLSNVNGDVITPVGTISFDYKLDDIAAGDKNQKMSLILRRASDGNWTNNYESYTFVYEGVRYSPANITCETLEDGYIHVVIDLTGFEYDDYGVLDFYKWSTVGGYVDNIQWTEAPVKMRGERFEAGVDLTKTLSNVNGDEITPIGTISFDYKLDAEAEGDKSKTFGLILRRASEGNWTNAYESYTFKYEGTRYSYDNVTTEALEDGYIRVTIDLTGFEYDDYGVFSIYGSWTNIGGFVDNIQWTEKTEEPDAPVIRGTAFQAGASANNEGFETAVYSTIVFDYKLDGEGTLDIRLRSSSYNYYYGQFSFNVNGEVSDYAGVTTEKLADGYIRVTIKTDEVTTHTSTKPTDTANIQIYKTTTVGGYLEIIELIEA